MPDLKTRILFGTNQEFGTPLCISFKSALQYGYDGVDLTQGKRERPIGIIMSENKRQRDSVFLQIQIIPKVKVNDIITSILESTGWMYGRSSNDVRHKHEYLDCVLLQWPGPFRKWTEFPILGKRKRNIDFINGRPSRNEKIKKFSRFKSGVLRMRKYKQLQRARDLGLCKRIGLSNASLRQIRQILDAGFVIDVIQNEYHIYLQNESVRIFCVDNGIEFQAHSMFIGGNDEVIAQIASENAESPHTTIMRWFASKRITVVPGSSDMKHILQNIRTFRNDDPLSLDQLRRIRVLDRSLDRRGDQRTTLCTHVKEFDSNEY